MPVCWCGKKHGKGSQKNGEVKHFVANWKLYWLRTDREKEKKD